MYMHIDSYSFGNMVVDGKSYDKDLIIFPGRIQTGWLRKKGHTLLADDLGDVIKYKPDILIIGKGASGRMAIPESTKQLIYDAKIKIVEENTPVAVELYNELIKKGENVVAVFHLTC